MFTELKAALISCMFPLDKCRGQAYDEAANMSGKHRGIAALNKKEESAAVHVATLLSTFTQSFFAGCYSYMFIDQ